MKLSSQSGRVVIITGASAGIGRAVALRFAHAGDRIGLIARDEAALADVRREIEAIGAQAEFEAVDVSDAEGLFRRPNASKNALAPSTSGSTTRWRRCSPASPTSPHRNFVA